MRKSIVLACICVITFTKISAQTSIKPGLKTGLNFSKFENPESRFKTDFYLGGFADIKLSKLYTLQPELLYSRQGAYISESVANSSVKIDAKYLISYISLGIINKFIFKNKFQIMVGPSLDVTVEDNFKFNQKNNPTEFDIALISGVGYSFTNGLTLEARFKQGVMDVFRGHYTDTNDKIVNNLYLNQLFQLGVAYTFETK